MLDQLRKQQILRARQLLKENAPSIYQIFAENKRIKNEQTKGTDEVSKVVQSDTHEGVATDQIG